MHNSLNLPILEICLNICLNVLLYIYRLVFTERARKQIIIRKLRLSPRRNKLNVDVNLIVNFIDYGDWKLMYHILRNMNSETFSEFCEHLTDKIRHECGNDTDSCLKVEHLLNDTDPNLNANAPDEDKKEFMTMDDLGDGNYMRSSSPKESQI